MHCRRAWLVVLLPALAAGPWAHAQDARSSVRGLVVSRQSQTPIEGAKIVLRRQLPGDSTVFDTTIQTSSDRQGRFQFDRLRAGRYLIEAAHLADTLPPTVLELARAERIEVELTVGRLLPPDSLPPVLPTLVAEAGTVPPSMAARDDFERRRRMGLGQFITRDMILARNPPAFVDLFRMASGMEVRCRGGDCLPRMIRARPGCWPTVHLDGVATDVRVLTGMRTLDVHAVEVYLGASETPLEFLSPGRPQRCGLIVVWTRFNSDERNRQPPGGPAKP